MSLAPGTRLGAYQVVSLIGTGGMGEVYRARDTRLEREVAVKVIPAAFATDAGYTVESLEICTCSACSEMSQEPA